MNFSLIYLKLKVNDFERAYLQPATAFLARTFIR